MTPAMLPPPPLKLKPSMVRCLADAEAYGLLWRIRRGWVAMAAPVVGVFHATATVEALVRRDCLRLESHGTAARITERGRYALDRERERLQRARQGRPALGPTPDEEHAASLERALAVLKERGG